MYHFWAFVANELLTIIGQIRSYEQKTESAKSRSYPLRFNFLIKTAIALALCYVLYYQVISKKDIDLIREAFFQQLSPGQLPWLIAAAILMPLNWALETEKWRLLIRRFEPLPFLRAYKAVVCGITFSLFTPNRIGEYGGRILYVSPENNWKAVIATLVGSFSQLMVLIGCGVVGLYYTSTTFLSLDAYVSSAMLTTGAGFIALMLFCFYNVELIIPFARKLPWPKFLHAFVRQFTVLRHYTSKMLSAALLLSLMRYLVYSLQYYLMLRFLGIAPAFLPAMGIIASIYLLQTSIPLPPFMDLIARSNIAVYFWGFFSDNELAILTATFGLWILNLLAPALVGMALILKTNVMKSLGYGKKVTQA